jgi:hypothetical protein
MKRYNVLWLEDEPEKNPNFRENAGVEGIDLILVKTVSEFKQKYSENIKMLDGVILDGKGKINDSHENEDLSAVYQALSFMDKNSHLKDMPKCIFSAYLGGGKSESAEELLREVKKFKKNYKDEEELFIYIKAAADEQKHTQIKHNNEIFFNSIKEYGIEVQNLFIDIILSLKVETSRLDYKFYFTHIRIVLEQMFRKANKIGLLHDFCINKGKVNLTDSSLFLSGKNTYNSNGAKASISHFPNIISNSVYNILTITGAASHTTDPDYENNINIQEYRKSIKTPYLLYNLTFQLMDILIWFDEYIKQNPDPEENKKQWKIVSPTFVKAIISKDAGGNYFCGEYKFQHSKINNFYSLGQELQIVHFIANNDASTPEYKYFVTDFKKVE